MPPTKRRGQDTRSIRSVPCQMDVNFVGDGALSQDYHVKGHSMNHDNTDAPLRLGLDQTFGNPGRSGFTLGEPTTSQMLLTPVSLRNQRKRCGSNLTHR